MTSAWDGWKRVDVVIVMVVRRIETYLRPKLGGIFFWVFEDF
jgi:hypothetical protein